MTSPQWLLTWWSHYGVPSDHQLFVLAVHDGDQQLIGLAPWYLKHHRLFGRRIHSLGDGEACTDHVGLICHPDRKREISLALADWLMSVEGTAHARLVQLNNVDADDQTLSLFGAACTSRGAWVERRPSPSSWHVNLPRTWEKYLASLSRNHRKRCRRWDRTFFQNQRVRIRVADSPGSLTEGMQILARLHSSRRKSVGCRGAFERKRFHSFHTDVMRRMYDTNCLRLAWLETDEKPIAIEYQMVSSDCVYAYQSGMDATCAEISPGSLSVMASIRWAIENGMRRFDFMRGDEAYKTSWGATRVHTCHLRIRPSRITDTLRHGVSLATYQTHSWLKRHRRTLRALQQDRGMLPKSLTRQQAS
jgi:CelD/BcsL family acetyltransferase involved in cellulose biosynthesis